MGSSRRKHRRNKNKWNGVIFGLLALLAVGYIFVGPRLYRRLKVAKRPQQEARAVISERAVTIFNTDSRDWKDLTITLNDAYEAAIPWIALNSSKEIPISDFKPKSPTNPPISEPVTNVVVTTAGNQPISLLVSNVVPKAPVF